MSFWIELHCDRRHPGCRTDKGDIFGMKASSTGNTPVTMSHLSKVARLEGWKRVGRKWICPSCNKRDA
jgi:hypothetical protein